MCWFCYIDNCSGDVPLTSYSKTAHKATVLQDEGDKMREQRIIGMVLCALSALMFAMQVGTAGLICGAWGVYCLITQKVWVK